MSIIEVNNLTHEYKEYDADDKVIGSFRAVSDVTLAINEGDFVALIGHNGSGKSTLAKHLNALLLPSDGNVTVNGKDTKTWDPIWEIRADAGMIFQNPDNQIIGTTVEEDVAFGPENVGMEPIKIRERIDKMLGKVGMSAFVSDSPNKLSGGQKQRVAIAGVLAMKPRCILFDEPTAMLDPVGRKEVLDTIHEINEKEKITVVLITHYMEEAVRADKVIVMDEGKVLLTGTPREVFSHIDLLSEHHLTVPDVTMLAHTLKKEGLPIPEPILTTEEFTEAICNLF